MLLDGILEHVLAVAAGDFDESRLEGQWRLRRIRRDLINDPLEIDAKKTIGELKLCIGARRQQIPFFPRQRSGPINVFEIHLLLGGRIPDEILTPRSNDTRAHGLEPLGQRSLRQTG